MKKKILVIGSLNMDIVIDMKKIPQVGETVLGNKVAYIPGGKGANQTVAASRLGGEVVMLGCTGMDEMGEKLICSLKDSGADVSRIRRMDGVTTGMAYIYVDDKGNNNIVVVPGANSCCDRNYLKENDDLFRECEYIVLQMEIPYDAVEYAVERGKELGKKVILNPAPAPEKMPAHILEKVDYLTPNEHEVVLCAGVEGLSPEEAARHINTMGAENVLVTLGDKGTCLSRRGELIYVPARKVEAVDTTAAGDCFNGALAVALAEGMEEKQAIEFANFAASVAVTRKGAQTAMPDRKDVEQIYKIMESNK